ncbi:MAG TPA: hypothetical protein VHF06_32975 [Pseudonocardiaceae bacterium]|nr:hypothetical protein [Pseudonocardiaceae bacterium]
MFGRRLSAALTLGAALVAVTACSTSGTPSAAVSTTQNMPAPAQLLDSVKSAISGATAVHIKGSLVDSGDKIGMDLQLNKDGSASGSISEGGSTIPLIVVDNVYYVKFTKAVLDMSGVDASSAAGQLLQDKWVSSKSTMLAGSDMVSGLKPLLDYNTLFDQILSSAGSETPKEAGTDNVNGVEAHVYTLKDNTTIDIASSTPHYPVRVIAPKSEGPGQLDFTGWSQPVKVSPPPANEIYSGPGA